MNEKMQATAFKPGDIVEIVSARFHAWLWVGTRHRLLQRGEDGYWKTETESDLAPASIHYFHEDEFQHADE